MNDEPAPTLAAEPLTAIDLINDFQSVVALHKLASGFESKAETQRLKTQASLKNLIDLDKAPRVPLLVTDALEAYVLEERHRRADEQACDLEQEFIERFSEVKMTVELLDSSEETIRVYRNGLQRTGKRPQKVTGIFSGSRGEYGTIDLMHQRRFYYDLYEIDVFSDAGTPKVKISLLDA